MRRRTFVLFGSLSTLAAKTVPNRYIVQFTDDPKTLPTAQKTVREYIESRHGRILTSMDTVIKAFSVEMDSKTADAVKKIPGVAAVKPNRLIPRKADKP